MNRNQILLLLGALVIIGAAGLLSFKHDASSWRSGGAAAGSKVLPAFDLNAVTQVVITSGADKVHLLQKAGIWTVQERANYPAAFSQVADLVRKIWELKVVESVPIGAAQLGRLNLEEPAKDKKTGGTLVDLLDAKNQRVAAILLGKPFVKKTAGLPEGAGGMPVGRYVMAEPASGNAALVSEAFLTASGSAETWLDHTFIQAAAALSLSSSGAAPVEAWTISRAKESDAWKLDGAKPTDQMDPAKALAATGALAQPMFNDVRAGDASAKTFEAPTKLTLKTVDHFTYEYTVGAAEGESRPVKVAITADFPARIPGAKEEPEQKAKLDGEFANQTKLAHEKLQALQRFSSWVYLIPKSQLEAALVSRASLLTPAPAPPPSMQPMAPPGNP